MFWKSFKSFLLKEDLTKLAKEKKIAFETVFWHFPDSHWSYWRAIPACLVPHHLYLETLTYAHVDDLAYSLLSRIRFEWYSLCLFYDDIHRSNRKLSKNPRNTRSNSFSSESETEKQRKSSSGSEAESSSFSNALLVKAHWEGASFSSSSRHGQYFHPTKVQPRTRPTSTFFVHLL